MPLRRSRFVAWIAAFAVVVQALWPLLSHARPKDQPLLAPVCTIDGITHYLDLKTGKAPLEERTALHGEHCTLCVFGADRSVTLPPSDAVPAIAVSAVSESAISPLAPIPEPLNHPPAQPRAPPRFL